MTESDIELVIEEGEAGKRLDVVLAGRKIGFSRARLQGWIADGRVQVDGAAAVARQRVRAGQRVVLRPAPPEPSVARAQDLPLSIVHEDADVVVVSKPPGLVVHPAPGHADGTLVNALLHHVDLSGLDDPTRPGIVHRIDRDTSGLLVVAKTVAAREALVERFRQHTIEREYVAIVLGHVADKRTYDTMHGRHPRDRKRFSSRLRQGKRAVTHVERIERLHAASLVRCQLETGRTHQIRVHLADDDHPVLADDLYGRKSRDPRVREAAEAIGRLALHARVLGFPQPSSGEPLRFEAEPPDDFVRALELLR
jgi:23S rRNA pseudouridine1911/1915/1917 synthase